MNPSLLFFHWHQAAERGECAHRELGASAPMSTGRLCLGVYRQYVVVSMLSLSAIPHNSSSEAALISQGLLEHRKSCLLLDSKKKNESLKLELLNSVPHERTGMGPAGATSSSSPRRAHVWKWRGCPWLGGQLTAGLPGVHLDMCSPWGQP